METALTSPFVLLKQAWTLAITRPTITSFFILGAAPQIFSLALSALIAYGSSTTDLQTAISGLFTNTGGWGGAGLIVIGLAVLVIVSLISTWYIALLYKVYQATAAGNLMALTAYMRPAKEVTLHLIVTSVMVGLFASVGFLLLIIPGIIITVRYMFAPMIAAVEDASIKPIEESKRLVKGRFWKLVVRSILLVAFYRIPLSILQAIHPLFGSVWAITSPIFGLYFYLVYMDFKQTAAVTT